MGKIFEKGKSTNAELEEIMLEAAQLFPIIS